MKESATNLRFSSFRLHPSILSFPLTTPPLRPRAALPPEHPRSSSGLKTEALQLEHAAASQPAARRRSPSTCDRRRRRARRARSSKASSPSLCRAFAPSSRWPRSSISPSTFHGMFKARRPSSLSPRTFLPSRSVVTLVAFEDVRGDLVRVVDGHQGLALAGEVPIAGRGREFCVFRSRPRRAAKAPPGGRN